VGYDRIVREDKNAGRGGVNWPNSELGAVMRAWGRVQRAIGGEAARFFGDLEITTAQMRTLGQLKHRGRLSGRELASSLGINPGTVVPHIDRLEEQGLVRRVVDQADRRLTWVELTPAGEQFFERLWRGAGQRVMEAIAGFTVEERQAFERFLNRVADHLEQREGVAETEKPE
jgi:DNA-binding MarR family transcriptional regulator